MHLYKFKSIKLQETTDWYLDWLEGEVKALLGVEGDSLNIFTGALSSWSNRTEEEGLVRKPAEPMWHIVSESPTAGDL